MIFMTADEKLMQAKLHDSYMLNLAQEKEV